jgi:hypothetical protein
MYPAFNLGRKGENPAKALPVEERFFKSQEASFFAIGSRKPDGRVTGCSDKWLVLA